MRRGNFRVLANFLTGEKGKRQSDALGAVILPEIISYLHAAQPLHEFAERLRASRSQGECTFMWSST